MRKQASKQTNKQKLQLLVSSNINININRGMNILYTFSNVITFGSRKQSVNHENELLTLHYTTIKKHKQQWWQGWKWWKWRRLRVKRLRQPTKTTTETTMVTRSTITTTRKIKSSISTSTADIQYDPYKFHYVSFCSVLFCSVLLYFFGSVPLNYFMVLKWSWEGLFQVRMFHQERERGTLTVDANLLPLLLFQGDWCLLSFLDAPTYTTFFSFFVFTSVLVQERGMEKSPWCLTVVQYILVVSLIYPKNMIIPYHAIL